MKFKFVFAVILFTAWTTHSQVLESPKFGKGLFNLVGKDSSWTMKVGTRIQLLAISNWEQDNKNETNFLVRRARLKFDGYAFSPKLEYKIELGLSNRDISGASQFTSNAPRYILDAVVKWKFAPNFELWFGQTKLPGNVERVISSGNLALVDRSLLNSRFNIDRDMGFQLRHKFNLTDTFVVREKLAFSQGEGRNITSGNLGGHQYTARVELLPFGTFESKGDYSGADLKREQSPKLSIAATYDFNDNAVKDRSNLGGYMMIDDGEGLYETDITTIFVDAMFKYRGFSFMGEYAKRDADDPFAKNSDDSLTGDVVQVGNALNLQATYLFRSNWAVTGRVTTVDWDNSITTRSDRNQYTFGVSKYIVGHKLKIQTDISHLDVANGNNELMYRLQMDLHF